MALKLSTKEKTERKTQAIERLHNLLPSGTVVKSVCTGYTKSGMGARYRFMVAVMERPYTSPDEDPKPAVPAVRDITGDMSDVLDWRWTDDGSMFVAGCGLDRALHAVSSLASIIRHHTGDETFTLKKENL